MATLVWGAGSTTGSDGDWNTATNWTGDALPANGDDVVFNGTATSVCSIGATAAVALNSITVAASNIECAWAPVYVPGPGPFDTGFYYYPYKVYTLDLDVGAGSKVPIITIDSANYSFGDWLFADALTTALVPGIRPIIVVDTSVTTEAVSWSSFTAAGFSTGCLGQITFSFLYTHGGTSITTNPTNTLNISFSGNNFNLIPMFPINGYNQSPMNGVIRDSNTPAGAGVALNIDNLTFSVILGSATTLERPYMAEGSFPNPGTTTFTIDFEEDSAGPYRTLVSRFLRLEFVNSGGTITVENMVGAPIEAEKDATVSFGNSSRIKFSAATVILKNCSIDFSSAITMTGALDAISAPPSTGGSAETESVLISATSLVELYNSTLGSNAWIVGNLGPGVNGGSYDLNKYYNAVGMAGRINISSSTYINLKGSSILKNAIQGGIAGGGNIGAVYGNIPADNILSGIITCYDDSALESYSGFFPTMYGRSKAIRARIYIYVNFVGPSLGLYATINPNSDAPFDFRNSGSSF